MSRKPGVLQMWWWQRRINRMRCCKSVDELRAKYGNPDHEVAAGEVTIWHYPLRVIGDTLYGIHVAIIDGLPNQVYLHMEPVAT